MSKFFFFFCEDYFFLVIDDTFINTHFMILLKTTTNESKNKIQQLKTIEQELQKMATYTYPASKSRGVPDHLARTATCTFLGLRFWAQTEPISHSPRRTTRRIKTHNPDLQRRVPIREKENKAMGQKTRTLRNVKVERDSTLRNGEERNGSERLWEVFLEKQRKKKKKKKTEEKTLCVWVNEGFMVFCLECGGCLCKLKIPRH